MYWESKRNNAQKSLSVDLLDGHYHSKGENKHDTYEVHVAKAHSEYDFIFLSVSHGFVKETIDCLSLANLLIQNHIPIHFNVKEDGRHCEEDWEKEVPEIFDFLWTGL